MAANLELDKVAEMIKKTFRNKDQKDCFDGCILYVQQQCSISQVACQKVIIDKLDEMATDIKDIKTEIGINGRH